MAEKRVLRVEEEHLAQALDALEEIDQDAANLLRAQIDAYRLFELAPWEVRELLDRTVQRCWALAVELCNLQSAARATGLTDLADVLQGAERKTREMGGQAKGSLVTFEKLARGNEDNGE